MKDTLYLNKITNRFSNKEIAMFILYYNNVYKGDIADWFGMSIQDFSNLINQFDCLMRSYKPINNIQIIKLLSDNF